MNASLHPAHRHSLSALSLLFARYVAGHINEAAWQQLTHVFDAGVGSLDERDAFAYFISDACNDLGPDALKVPRLDEVEAMLTCARAA